MSVRELHLLNARHERQQQLEDYRHGQTAYMIYLAHRDSSKGGEALTIEAFMPTVPRPKPKQLSDDELVAMIEKLAAGTL